MISPKSVLSVWRKALIDRGIPAETITVIDAKKRDEFELAYIQNDFDYYIMHYDAIAKLPSLKKSPWFCIIGDEIHGIKGRNSLRTKALKKIKAEYKMGLTGTPADNRIEDLWSIYNWLWPKDFSSYWKFVERYLKYWTHPKKQFKVITGPKESALPEYWSRLEGVYLRRLLVEVAPNMPKTTYTRVEIPITGRQQRDYMDMADENMAELALLEDPDFEIDLLSGYTIETFTRLQQLAIGECFVKEYQKWVKPKDSRQDQRGEWRVVNGTKKWFYGHWETKENLHLKNSPKVDYIVDYLKDNPDEALVIACQHNDTAEYIARKMVDLSIPCVIHGGNSTTEQRDNAVDDFMNRKISRVFIGTFGTIKEGIDLSREGHIMMVDRCWPTMRNIQTENRVRNVLKTLPIQVTDLVATIPGRETIDEYRLALLETKNEHITMMTEPPK